LENCRGSGELDSKFEQGESLKCEIEGLWADLQIEFKFQGVWCKVRKGDWIVA
jgi:hypothetical protein